MRPGINVSVSSVAPTRSFPSETGTAFMAGLTSKGRTDRPVLVRSLKEYTQVFGPRVSYGFLYDGAEVFFREGGSSLYVGRTVGPAATKDRVSLLAAATPALRVETKGAGTSELTVQVVAGTAAGTRVLVVFDNAIEVERSYDLADNDAAVFWGDRSEYVTVVKLAETLPDVVAATALAGGADDRAAITDVHRTNTLALFTADLGPGQVLFPGATTATMHTALLQHAKTLQIRFAILDAADTAVAAALVAAADAQRAITTVSPSYGILVGPWAKIPGVVPNTTRTVPYSVVQAGLIAALDGQAGNPNIPAAGSEGESKTVLSLAQVYSDADRELLNNKGVVIAKMVFGRCRTYGYRTLADVNVASYDGFLEAGAARLRMAIINESLGGGEQFMFDQIDGRGQTISAWDSFLTGLMAGYHALGALFGEAPDDAYLVDTGPTVNTPTTLADNQLNAQVAIRISPFAEMVNLDISRVSVTQSL